MFNMVNVSKKWNIPQKHRIDTCFNCSDPDHGIPKCPTPIIHKRIDRPRSSYPKVEAYVEGLGSRDGQFGHGSGYGRCEGNITFLLWEVEKQCY